MFTHRPSIYAVDYSVLFPTILACSKDRTTQTHSDARSHQETRSKPVRTINRNVGYIDLHSVIFKSMV